MDLKQLTYFITIVQEGNISNAAKKLYLSQPPLSNQMKQLEEEFHCILFERGARQIQLTQAGRLLYDRAVAILEMADIAKKELMDYQGGAFGTLRLGVVSSVGSTLLSNWAKAFQRQYSQVCFELCEANTYQLLEQLRSGSLDLAIVRTPFSSKTMVSTPLLDEPMLAVGHETYFKDIPAPSIPLEKLSEKPLILYRRWEQILQEIWDSANLSPVVICKNDDARTTAFWADAGLGVGIIPASTKPLLHNPETVSKVIEDRRLYSSICAVHHENGYLSHLASVFISFIKEYQIKRADDNESDL